MAGQDMAGQDTAGKDTAPLSSDVPSYEMPTSSAYLVIRLAPVRVEAGMRVPASEASLILTAFSMVSVVIIGAAAAIITLYLAHGLAILAIVELALTFAIVALIAVAARRRTQMRRNGKPPPTIPGPENVITRERS